MDIVKTYATVYLIEGHILDPNVNFLDLGEDSYSEWFLSHGGFPSDMLYSLDGSTLRLSGRAPVRGIFSVIFDTNNFWGNPTKQYFIWLVVEAQIDVRGFFPTVLYSRDAKKGEYATSKPFFVSGGSRPYSWRCRDTKTDGMVSGNVEISDNGTVKVFVSALSASGKGGITTNLGVTDQNAQGGHELADSELGFTPESRIILFPNMMNGWRKFKIAVEEEITVSGPKNLPDGVINEAYPQQQFRVTGGTSPFTFKLMGDLPPGMRLDPQFGTLGGTPTTPGVYAFLVGATDINQNGAQVASQEVLEATLLGALSGGNGWTDAYSLKISSPKLRESVIEILGPLKLPDGVANKAYPTQTIYATGGAKPYQYTSSGVLPPGLHIEPGSGEFKGVPTQVGTYTFYLGATDKNQNGGREVGMNGWHAKYTLQIKKPVIRVFGRTDLPHGTVNERYPDQRFYADGGTPPYTFLINGTLPPGLKLSAFGLLDGTPTTPGTYEFYVGAQDLKGYGGDTADMKNGWHVDPYIVTVLPPPAPLAVNFSGPDTWQAGIEFTGTIDVSGGEGPYSLSFEELPAGLSLAAGQHTATLANAGSRKISGILPNIGKQLLIIVVRDARGQTDRWRQELEVTPASKLDSVILTFENVRLEVLHADGKRYLAAKGVVRCTGAKQSSVEVTVIWTSQFQESSIVWQNAIYSRDNSWEFVIRTLRDDMKGFLNPELRARVQSNPDEVAHRNFVFPDANGLIDVETTVNGTVVEIDPDKSTKTHKLAAGQYIVRQQNKIDIRIKFPVGIARLNVYLTQTGVPALRESIAVRPFPPAESKRFVENWNGNEATQMLSLSAVPAQTEYAISFIVMLSEGAHNAGIRQESVFTIRLEDPEVVKNREMVVSAFRSAVSYSVKLSA